MDFIKTIFKNKRLLFCYFLFGCSVLFALLLLIVRPTKMNPTYPYNYSKQEIKEVSFPIVQHFHYELGNLRIINLFFQDESLNKYNFKIDVVGEETGHKYFSYDYIDYNSSIVAMEFNEVSKEKDNNFFIKIDCNDCENVKMSLRKSNNDKNYIEGRNDNRILEFNLINDVPNNGYYWYSIVGIIISLMLYPFAKEEK